MSSVLGGHCGICVNVKLNLVIIAKTTEATVPFLQYSMMYGCLGLKKEKNGNKGGSTLIWTTFIIQIQESLEKTRELSPDDFSELRALGTLSLSLVTKINPHISIITRPHPYRRGFLKLKKKVLC